jgi:hypothetical protein
MVRFLRLGLLFGLSFVCFLTVAVPTGGAQSSAAHQTQATPPLAGPLSPQTAVSYLPSPLAEARTLFRKGEFDAAIEKYRQILLLVPTSIGDVPGKLFLLDRGAFTNHITPAAAREVTEVHGDSDTTVQGLSGSVDKVYRADQALLQLGHLRQENQDLVAFDLTHISEASEPRCLAHWDSRCCDSSTSRSTIATGSWISLTMRNSGGGRVV